MLIISQVSLVCFAASMDVDDGEGNVLKDLPCVKRFNQLYCSSAGTSYPESAISTFANDNKALLRRMFGELQQPRPVTQTTVRILTHVVNTGFVAAPIVTTQTFQRFRRDVLEGTLEEMLDSQASVAGNHSLSKRQAEFPGNPEQDNSK